jgi:hypothetical protein
VSWGHKPNVPIVRTYTLAKHIYTNTQTYAHEYLLIEFKKLSRPHRKSGNATPTGRSYENLLRDDVPSDLDATFSGRKNSCRTKGGMCR